MVIYIESVFAFNVLVDYLLLFGAARVAGRTVARRRLLLGAAVGGIYAAVQLFLPKSVVLLLLGLALMGADGAIGSTYNIMPRTFVGIYNAVQAGDMATAMKLQHKADDLIEALLHYSVVEAVKVALTVKGYDVGEATYPLPRMSESDKLKLIADLKKLGYPEEF